MMINIDKSIGQIQELRPYLSEMSKKDLEHILSYGEKIRIKGEKKKKKFWKDHSMDDFKEILVCMCKDKEKLLEKYKYISSMDGLERERFIDEYLHDDMLYSRKLSEFVRDSEGGETYFERDWKEGNIQIHAFDDLHLWGNLIGDEGAKQLAKFKLEDRVRINLEYNNLGPEGAKAISHMKLEDGVIFLFGYNRIGNEGAKAIAGMGLKTGVKLNLQQNGIGDEGAEAISKMVLKDGVRLDLNHNNIGDKGVIAIAKNMEMEEGVQLDLSFNEIGDEGARAIMKNMKLKNGVILNLNHNKISDGVRTELFEWSHSFKGVNCLVKS